MLFKVDATKDVFELNPELKAIEEFGRLTDRQMKYVILATDYKSPFRKLSIEERRSQAALAAGYKLEGSGKRLDTNARNLVDGKVGNVEAAIKRYRELQKDEDYETLLSLSALIAQIREANNTPNKSMADLKVVVEMNIGKLDKLMQTKRELENILDMREDQQVAPNIASSSDEDSIDERSLPILAQLNQGII